MRTAAPTPIGIPAPTDPDDLARGADGQCHRAADRRHGGAGGRRDAGNGGQTLTVNQLTTLQFIPTPNLIGQSSTLTYSVSDPAGNTGFRHRFPRHQPATAAEFAGADQRARRRRKGSARTRCRQTTTGPARRSTSPRCSAAASTSSATPTPASTSTTTATSPSTGRSARSRRSQITAGFGNPIIAAFWADVDTMAGRESRPAATRPARTPSTGTSTR